MVGTVQFYSLSMVLTYLLKSMIYDIIPVPIVFSTIGFPRSCLHTIHLGFDILETFCSKKGVCNKKRLRGKI